MASNMAKESILIVKKVFSIRESGAMIKCLVMGFYKLVIISFKECLSLI
jgi:hypothetical protein